MTRPSLFTYLIGNWLCMPVIVLCSGAVIYLWFYQGNFTILAPIGAFMLGSSALTARREISAYREWSRQWNALGGVSEKPKGKSRIVQTLRFLFAVGAYVGFGCYLFVRHEDYEKIDYQCAVLVFLILNFGFIYKVWSRVPRKTKAYVAEVCLSPPKDRPVLSKATQKLPSYCIALLERKK